VLIIFKQSIYSIWFLMTVRLHHYRSIEHLSATPFAPSFRPLILKSLAPILFQIAATTTTAAENSEPLTIREVC